jgi:hypothetical protein
MRLTEVVFQKPRTFGDMETSHDELMNPEHFFFRCLSELARRGQPHSDAVCAAASQKLRQLLLLANSETPDNKALAQRVSYGNYEPEEDRLRYQGVKVGSTLISHILYEISDTAMPDLVKQRYPELTQADWEGGIRMASLVFSMMGHHYPQVSGTW